MDARKRTGSYDRAGMHVNVDPAGRFAIRATKRSVELWIVQRIAFDNRPTWQSRADGPVALLHSALSGLEPEAGDVLACVWACTDEEQRHDVENRLFTNVLPKFSGAPCGPNAFAGLPSRVRFERSFRSGPALDGFNSDPCLYYRYALRDQSSSWEEWRTPAGDVPLASWLDVSATGLRTGNGWATWASMRRPDTQVVVRNDSEAHHDHFALRLSIYSPTPMQLVANMEWIVDGVIASFQRELDRTRAEAVAKLLHPHLGQYGLTHDLVEAQCGAPRLFAPPPFQLNASHSRCHINPADDQLVAGDIELTVLPQLKNSALSGTLHRVK
jgi:hypothetical protein